jgi:hypothetical protein
MMSTSLRCRGATKLMACRSLVRTPPATKAAELQVAEAVEWLAAGVVVPLAAEAAAPVMRGLPFHPVPSKGKEKQAQVIGDDDEVSSDEDLPL